jgi:DNA repair protein RadC
MRYVLLYNNFVENCREKGGESMADNPHKGHRKRMKREVIAQDFPDSMESHRILEMLLFFGIPYKDTNVLAHELIDTFGSFSGVLEATPEKLIKVKGMTENAACLISMILPIYKRYILNLEAQKTYCEPTSKLAEFIRALYLDTTNERVYAICFDQKRSMIGYRMLAEGDISSSNADLRSLASAVLSINASSVIIAHNHPHGITVPSRTDIETTKVIYKFLNALKVKLLDHIIVNDTDYFSMAETEKYSYIFYGFENSPFDRDIDKELELAKEAYEIKVQDENISRAHKLVDGVISKSDI